MALFFNASPNPSGDLAPIKGVYYQELINQAKSVVQNLLSTGSLYTVDSSGLGNFPWYWNNTGTFNTATWNWLNNVFSFNQDNGYLETHNSSLATQLFNTYLQIVYKLSPAEQSKLNDDLNKAQAIVNTVVGDYTTIFGAIPPGNAGTSWDKISYVTQTVLSWGSKKDLTLMELQSALNPISLLGNAPFGTAKLINDFLEYLNATSATLSIQNLIATQNAELKKSALNLSPTPENVAQGWMKTQDTNGVSTIEPFLTIAQSTANIQNSLKPTSGGLSFSVKLTVQKINKNTVKISASGGAGASGWIDFFTFNVGGSASYNMFSFDETLTSCEVLITFKRVTRVTPQLSASAYQASSGVGWWNPDVINQAVHHVENTSGLQFSTPPVYNYETNGTFGVLSNIIISQVPTFSLTYKSTNTKIFEQIFEEQSSWSVGFLGIPLAGGKQSYYSSTFDADTTRGEITVKMSPPATDTPVSVLDQLAYVIGVQVDWPAGS